VPILLSELSNDVPARVLRLQGDPLVRERLVELGLSPGQVIRILRRAPLGDPLVVAVRGACLGIRRDEASCVLVELAEAAAPRTGAP
jgi:Fe2+ transport system protein FeoA